MVKITFIGAGSVVFTRELLSDLLAFEQLADVHIALYDIDAERLETAAAMARWTDAQFGRTATITTHSDRREALAGADFVINTVQVGMHAATLLDFEIPARYGLRQTIADTLGIGGIFRALRTIPVMLSLGEEIAEVAPDALLLNYTNPMAILCQAYDEGSPHKRIVGLCHSVQHTTMELAKLVEVPYRDVTFLGAGVNHQAFILRFEHDGEDLYPRLRAKIDADPELQRRVRVALYDRLGFYPTESSEHSAEYVGWGFLRDDELVERYRLKIGDYIQRSEDNMAEYASIKAGLASGEQFPLKRSLEYASLIVHATVTGQPQVIYGNVRNAGLIPGLPEQCAVEVPCLVDRTGLRPTPVRDYPPQLAALNRTFLNVADLTVRAALDGRRDHVLHAAMLDPATAATLNLDQIAALVDELLAAHGELMPEGLRTA